jgi:hypothetical protein
VLPAVDLTDLFALTCLERLCVVQAGQGAFSGGGRTISVEAAVWFVNSSLSAAGSCLGSLFDVPCSLPILI